MNSGRPSSRFLSLLKQGAGPEGVKILAVAAVAGVMQGFVMVTINGAAKNLPAGGLNFRYMLLFVLCTTAYVLAKRYSLVKASARIQRIISDIRIRITDKIRRSSLLAFEEVGKSQIYTALMENTETIYEAARLLAHASSAAVMLAFSFTYIFFLSPLAFLITTILIVGACSGYLVGRTDSRRELQKSIEKNNEFLDYLRHFTDGFKEVKVNSEKGDDLFESYLRKTSEESQEIRVKTETRFVDNFVFASTFLYVLLAATIFVLPQIDSVLPGTIINIVAVLLFVTGSLAAVVEAVPEVARAEVAVENIERLERQLAEGDDVSSSVAKAAVFRRASFDTISLEGVVFAYPEARADRHAFTLGPIDLTVRRGEVLFLVGGNGSGKSTLLKLISGLYYPHSGALFLDRLRIDATNAAHYRGLLSVIFSDVHLFDRLYGLGEVDTNKLEDLLDRMELGTSTSYENGRFTNLDLSTGQRKRLALACVCMEEKPVLVFDEVAADQDPNFRKYFYEVFLAEQKRQGRTVIVVSHDDRYFGFGDRTIRMEFGKFVA